MKRREAKSKGEKERYKHLNAQFQRIARRDKKAFFTVQLSHPYMTTGKTIVLTIQTFVGKVMSLLFNMLSRFVIAFLPSISYRRGKKKINQTELPGFPLRHSLPSLNSGLQT